VAGEAAVGVDAKMPVIGAEVFVTSLACRTRAASDPWIDRDALPDGRSFCAFTEAFDDAGNLVTKRKGERAIFGYVEALVVAESEVAVLQMQIRVANATSLDAYQHFGAARRGAIDHGFAERLTIGDKRLPAHLRHRNLLSGALRSQRLR
jgi:hypothetical protein